MKLILKIFMWLIILLIAVVIAAYIFINPIAKMAINRIMPGITGTPSSVEKVDLALFDGKIEIDGLKIGNPAGYTNPTAFAFKELEIKFQPRSILTNTIVVDSVSLDETVITAEVNTKGMNLKDLYNNVTKAGAKETAKPAAKETAKSTEGGRQVALKTVAVTDTTLKLSAFGGTTTIPMPDIRYTDGGKKSLPQTIASVLGRILKSAIDAVTVQGANFIKEQTKMAAAMAKETATQATEAVKSTASAAKETAKDVTDTTKEAAKSTAKGVKDAAKSVESGLKGIFK